MRSNDKRPTRPRGPIFLAIPAGVGSAIGGVTAGNAAAVRRLARGVGEIRRAVRDWEIQSKDPNR